MPPIPAIEAAAEIVVNVAKGIHSERLAPVVGEAFGARTVSQASEAAPEAAKEVATAPKAELLNANKALVRYVGDLMPQAANGQLDWILGGSSASNLLADARQISILDPANAIIDLLVVADAAVETRHTNQHRSKLVFLGKVI
jgi:hypothetical protein